MNIQNVLEKHKRWLNDEDGGEYADLRDANLSKANLSGADIDYSCWPLWCGSLDVTIDERIARQLAYHVLAVASQWLNPTQEQIDFANGFHRAGEVPKLESKEVKR